jgi:hypothetical protein
MIRRDFLKNLALVSTSALPLSAWRSAFAQESVPQQKPFFVLIRMQGGWDVTLNMDTYVHTSATDQQDIFIEYREDEIQRVNRLKFGPALSPLVPHADNLAFINGVLMNSQDNGHEASLGFISTGNGEGKAPSLPVEIANTLQAGPYGVIFSGNLTVLDRPVMLTSYYDLMSLDQSVRLDNLSSFLKNFSDESHFNSSIKNIISSTEVTSALTTAIESRREFINQQSTNSALQAAHVLAASFQVGAAHQGQIDMFPSLDTHSNHEQLHLTAQSDSWQTVSDLFKIFKETAYGNLGASLFDQTVFMVVSEFSRTPFLNPAKGKDHNPLTNSVLLAGGPIRGGTTFGASHVIPRSRSRIKQGVHVALPINFKTGEVATNRDIAERPEFHYITPDRVIASIARGLRVDEFRFKSADLKIPTIEGLFK